MLRNLSELALPGCLDAPRSQVKVRAVAPQSLAPATIEAWRHLGEQALEPNAYLMPMFVLPALAHLGPATPVHILLIETAAGQLIGVGVFQTKPLLPNWAPVALQSLAGYRSRHSFLTGLLVDRHQAVAAVEAFFDFVTGPDSRWHGVRFDWLNRESALGALLLDTARQRHIWWSESERMRRAVLLPKHGHGAGLVSRIAPPRLKDLRRRLRRLSEHGELDWRVHSGRELNDQVIESFLALEHMGWKGEAGTSLRSNPAHEQFFRTMIEGFRDTGGVFFTELLHRERVIASTCNLVSGNSAFAFKIGWDPGYARYSPGILNELHLLERAGELVGHLDLIDSGSVEGAFIDDLWFDKRELVSGTFATTRTGKLLCSLAALRRRARHLGGHLRGLTQQLLRPAGSSPPLPAGEKQAPP